MSDNYLRFISTDPGYAPVVETAERARLFLANLLPDAEEVTATTSDQIEFIDAAREIERLGYSALMLSDHLVDQFAPIATLGVAAAVTSTLRLGTFVFNNDLRHPVVLAQELEMDRQGAATLVIFQVNLVQPTGHRPGGQSKRDGFGRVPPRDCRGAARRCSSRSTLR